MVYGYAFSLVPKNEEELNTINQFMEEVWEPAWRFCNFPDSAGWLTILADRRNAPWGEKILNLQFSRDMAAFLTWLAYSTEWSYTPPTDTKDAKVEKTNSYGPEKFRIIHPTYAMNAQRRWALMQEVAEKIRAENPFAELDSNVDIDISEVYHNENAKMYMHSMPSFWQNIDPFHAKYKILIGYNPFRNEKYNYFQKENGEITILDVHNIWEYYEHRKDQWLPLFDPEDHSFLGWWTRRNVFGQIRTFIHYIKPMPSISGVTNRIRLLRHMTKIILQCAQFLKKTREELLAEAENNREAQMEATKEFLVKQRNERKEQEIRKVQEHLQLINEELDSLVDKLQRQHFEKVEQEKYLEQLQSAASSKEIDLESMLQEILSLDNVVDAWFRGLYLYVKTTPDLVIPMEEGMRDLGQVLFEIPLGNSQNDGIKHIRAKNLTYPELPASSHFIQPIYPREHGWWEACWGGAAATVAPLLAQLELYELVMYLISFVEAKPADHVGRDNARKFPLINPS